MIGHWSRTCRTPKHLVELYQASLKEKDKNVEANVLYQNNDPNNIFEGLENLPQLEVGDFLENTEYGDFN